VARGGGRDKLVRWSNIDKVLLKVYLFAEHNNKRHKVRTCYSGEGSATTIDTSVVSGTVRNRTALHTQQSSYA
jgi:hypothetical protein